MLSRLRIVLQQTRHNEHPHLLEEGRVGFILDVIDIQSLEEQLDAGTHARATVKGVRLLWKLSTVTKNPILRFEIFNPLRHVIVLK